MSEEVRNQPWVRSLQDLAATLPGLLTDRLELLTLELKRASRGIVQVVALMLLTVILGATAWLALWGGITLTLVALGWSWPLAMLAVVLVNLMLAWAALARIRRLAATLDLPATRRHLAFGAGVGAPASGHLSAQPLATPLEATP